MNCSSGVGKTRVADELLASLARAGRAVLVISHQLNLIARFADAMVLLHEGQVAAASARKSQLQADMAQFSATQASEPGVAAEQERADPPPEGEDLFAGEEGVGQVSGRLAMRGEVLSADFEAASPRRAKLVKLRYFAGLSVPEAARALGISPRTADRVWAFARAWLRCQLGGGPTGESSPKGLSASTSASALLASPSNPTPQPFASAHSRTRPKP